MEEVLIQILLMVAAVFFEALLELGGGALLDVLSRVAADLFKPAEPPNAILLAALSLAAPVSLRKSHRT
jgi:hypothetical protein